MKTVALLALAFIGCCYAQQYSGPHTFQQYAGSDNLMQENELVRYWLHFDSDGDGQITKQEFDTAMRDEGYPHASHAPQYFVEMDVVKDEVINSLDFPHIFRLFDEDGDGVISEREGRTNANAYFLFN